MKLRLFVAGFGVVVSHSYAEENLQMAAYTPMMGDEVVVTATRSPSTVKDTLASTTVVTREQIERSQARDLYQVLRNLAGLQLRRNGGRGNATSVSIRGVGVSGTLVLVDGINIESATLGQATLEQLSVDQVERIEVLRGPKSSLYGSSAMGGVVQIFTRKASAQDGVTYAVGGGSNNTVDTTISATGSTDSSRFNVTASHLVSDGIDVQSRDDDVAGEAAFDEDGFHRSSLSLNLEQDFTDSLSATVILNKSLGETEIDDYSLSAANEYPYSEADSTLYSLSLNYDLDQFSSKLQYGKLVDTSETYSDSISSTPDYDMFETQRQQGVWENSFDLSSDSVWNFGMDYTHEEVVSTNDYTQSSRDNFGGYLNVQSKVSMLSSSIGLRHDDNEQFGSYLTGDVGLGLDVSEGTVISLNMGTAYKAPSFNDLYWPTVGNPNLQPEEIKSAELGMETYQDAYIASFRIYRSEVENLISWAPAPTVTDPNRWIPQNVDNVNIKGAELQAGAELIGLLLSASFTYERAKDAATDQDLVRKPRRRLSVDVDKQVGNVGLGVTFYAQSQHYEDVSGTGRVVMSGFGDMAVRYSHQVNDEITVRARVDNLFDNDYVETYGYNTEGRFLMVFFDYAPK